MPSPTQITALQLARLTGTPAAPVIIDVCIDDDFALDPYLIPGARRCDYRSVASLLPELQQEKLVVVCQKGLKLSQGAAAMLRAHGLAAETLEGGMSGWRNKQLPVIAAGKIPPRNERGQTVWVTRHRPKIDRLACPWLIRRFVDPRAQFLFVAPDQVLNVADKFSATPFDIEDVFFSHRGEHCSFDTMLHEFGLELDALAEMATIVRAADTNRHELAPEAAGLLAVSLGLSRMYKEDLALLEAGMLVYDALYRFARDARNEGHDWPTGKTGS